MKLTLIASVVGLAAANLELVNLSIRPVTCPVPTFPNTVVSGECENQQYCAYGDLGGLQCADGLFGGVDVTNAECRNILEPTTLIYPPTSGPEPVPFDEARFDTYESAGFVFQVRGRDGEVAKKNKNKNKKAKAQKAASVSASDSASADKSASGSASGSKSASASADKSGSKSASASADKSGSKSASASADKSGSQSGSKKKCSKSKTGSASGSGSKSASGSGSKSASGSGSKSASVSGSASADKSGSGSKSGSASGSDSKSHSKARDAEVANKNKDHRTKYTDSTTASGEKSNGHSSCSYKCVELSSKPGHGCTNSNSITKDSLCQGQAVTNIIVECAEGVEEGLVHCGEADSVSSESASTESVEDDDEDCEDEEPVPVPVPVPEYVPVPISEYSYWQNIVPACYDAPTQLFAYYQIDPNRLTNTAVSLAEEAAGLPAVNAVRNVFGNPDMKVAVRILTLDAPNNFAYVNSAGNAEIVAQQTGIFTGTLVATFTFDLPAPSRPLVQTITMSYQATVTEARGGGGGTPLDPGFEFARLAKAAQAVIGQPTPMMWMAFMGACMSVMVVSVVVLAWFAYAVVAARSATPIKAEVVPIRAEYAL